MTECVIGYETSYPIYIQPSTIHTGSLFTHLALLVIDMIRNAGVVGELASATMIFVCLSKSPQIVCFKQNIMIHHATDNISSFWKSAPFCGIFLS